LWAREEDSLGKIYRAKFIGTDNFADTTSRLKFKAIRAQEFIAFKKAYHNPIDTSIERILHSKTGFEIKTADSLYTYKYYDDNFGEYKGYIKPLKLYLIYSGNGPNEIAWIEAIDSLNNKSYLIEPDSDDGLMQTRVSPGVKYILWFSNYWYGDRYSFISIVKINHESNFFKYKDYLGHRSGEWLIDEIVWINDNSFALRIYDEEAENRRLVNVRYLKASF
jgi:hypothetical protein